MRTPRPSRHLRCGAHTKHAAAILAAAAVAAGAGACRDTEPDARAPATTDPPPLRHGGDFYDGRTIRWSRSASEEPDTGTPAGDPPPCLTTRELRSGTGPKVQMGDTVVVNHIGLTYSSGRKHDTTYGPNAVPLEVKVGGGAFIEGFELGLVGMRAGERRMVTVPPRLGYGASGYGAPGTPSGVGPGETLVYVIDLEAIVDQPAHQRARRRQARPKRALCTH